MGENRMMMGAGITKEEPKTKEQLASEFQAMANEFRQALAGIKYDIARNASQHVLETAVDNFVIKWKGKFKQEKWKGVDGIASDLANILVILGDLPNLVEDKFKRKFA